ncbi:MAG: hypothetical protein JNK57_08770 [Planctomycetaceae bacterium]|nr:hypothetical protein [Planctomycetaceae bacterium]
MKSLHQLVPVICMGVVSGIVANGLWSGLGVAEFWRPVLSGVSVALAVMATLTYQNRRPVAS